MPEFDSTVEYRNVVGFPGYKIGNDGTFWSRFRKVARTWEMGAAWRQVRGNRTTLGYISIRLFPGRKYRLVHTLVLEAFVGPKPVGTQGCHFPDRDPANNSLANLRWDTSAGNHADQIAHGTTCRGEMNPAAKLTAEQVASIRQDYAAGRGSQEAIGRKHGVTQMLVSKIVRRLLWAHIH